jgi:hypothetical protein
MNRPRSTEEAVNEAPAAANLASPDTEPAAPSGQLDLLTLQRSIGNRATGRLLRSAGAGALRPGIGRAGAIALQREWVDDLWPTDPQTVNSPFPLRVLMHWLTRYPVAPHDLRYESAYDRSQVEPDPLGCEWKGGSSNISTVTDAFMRESGAHGYSFRRDDVFMTIRDQVASAKHERAKEIMFMPRSAWNAQDKASDTWFPWPAYEDDADQFSLNTPDPVKGPGGPIVDWLEWYEFDAPWPPVADPDAVMIHAQGERTGRVLGVVRLYCNDAIRAGYLGVDRSAVEAHVRRDLQERKQRKTDKDHSRFSRIDGRGRKQEPASTTQPAPPGSVKAPKADEDFQQTVGGQWTWTAGKAKPDRTVQIQFQKGSAIVQASINLDDPSQKQFMAGWQGQVSTKEIKLLGALVSAQAFVQLLGGTTIKGPASGTFTIQAAVGVQVTLKWGPVTVQLQGGPQVAWDPVSGWQAQFAASPATGPTTSQPPGVPPSGAGSGPLPPPVMLNITVPLPAWLGGG